MEKLKYPKAGFTGDYFSDSNRKLAGRPAHTSENALFLRSRCSRLLATYPYKRLAHREKPPHTVARRNARERRRVEAVNQAFSRLRKHVPTPSRGKRVSKVKTLRLAIDYIAYLQSLLQWSGTTAAAESGSSYQHSTASNENFYDVSMPVRSTDCTYQLQDDMQCQPVGDADGLEPIGVAMASSGLSGYCLWNTLAYAAGPGDTGSEHPEVMIGNLGQTTGVVRDSMQGLSG